MAGLSDRRWNREASGEQPGVEEAEDPLVDEDIRWGLLARCRHVAEAGYLAEELEQRLGAPVRIHAESAFEGTHHFWETHYLLLVPEETLGVARPLLKELAGAEEPVGESPPDTFQPEASRVDRSTARRRTSRTAWEAGRDDDDPRFRLEEDEGSGISWAPIVLTLTAGSAVFFGVRWMHDAPVHPPARPDAAGLWNAISRDAEPWTQPLPNGGERRLRFDPHRNELVIEEDFDGDGVPEKSQRFAGDGRRAGRIPVAEEAP